MKILTLIHLNFSRLTVHSYLCIQLCKILLEVFTSQNFHLKIVSTIHNSSQLFSLVPFLLLLVLVPISNKIQIQVVRWKQPPTHISYSIILAIYCIPNANCSESIFDLFSLTEVMSTINHEYKTQKFLISCHHNLTVTR